MRVCVLQLPGDIKLTFFDAENKMQEVSVDALTKGKKVRQEVLSWLLSRA